MGYNVICISDSYQKNEIEYDSDAQKCIPIYCSYQMLDVILVPQQLNFKNILNCLIYLRNNITYTSENINLSNDTITLLSLMINITNQSSFNNYNKSKVKIQELYCYLSPNQLVIRKYYEIIEIDIGRIKLFGKDICLDLLNYWNEINKKFNTLETKNLEYLNSNLERVINEEIVREIIE